MVRAIIEDSVELFCLVLFLAGTLAWARSGALMWFG